MTAEVLLPILIVLIEMERRGLSTTAVANGAGFESEEVRGGAGRVQGESQGGACRGEKFCCITAVAM